MKLSIHITTSVSLCLGLCVIAPAARATDSAACNAGTSLCDQGTAYLNALKEANEYACYVTTGQLAQKNTHNGKSVLLAPLDPSRYEAQAECYREFDHLYVIYRLYTSFFPAGATCSARPAITVAAGSGPVCQQGCEYQAAAGQSNATPTGATCVPPRPLDPGKNCPDCGRTGAIAVGDPVNMFTGVEWESAEDFRVPTGHLALMRFYSSSPDLPQLPGLGGPWRHSYMRAILSIDATTVRVVRANGTNYLFKKIGSGWKPDWDVSERLEEIIANGVTTGWTLIVNDDSRESYDAAGNLMAITYTDADALTLSYSAGKLVSVVDRQGRRLTFSYSGNSIASVVLPDGRTIQYSYDVQGRLTSIGYQRSDSSGPQYDVLQYRYEDPRFPNSLTSRLDEQSNVSASWMYDEEGRVTRSVHGDLTSSVDQVTIAYGVNGSTVTNALGESATHSYAAQLGRAKLAGSSKRCVGCGGSGLQSQTYDGSGYPDVSVDQSGGVTDQDYSPIGLLVRKVEAATDTAGRKRTTETYWSPDFRAPVRRYVYNAGGTLVRKETWTYNARGQMLSHSIVDP